MSSWLGAILKDPEKRAIASWLGGGAMAVAGIIGTAVTFFDHKAPHEQGPSPELVAQIQKPLADEIAAQRARNDKLTELLLEKNPAAAAAPGARQAVGEAVGLIAQGAEEGDPRLRQALGLLKDNKTAEAAQLLNAVAKDKSAHAERETAHAEQATAQAGKDRKEAAVAYRNLGAIAALHDLKGALKPYQDSLAIFERLAKSDPGNAGWQRDLAVSFAKLALVHKQTGDKANARGFLRQGRAIMSRLTKRSPDNAVWKQDLAQFDGQIAELAEP